MIGAETDLGLLKRTSSTRVVTYAAALTLIQLVWHISSAVPLTTEYVILSAIGSVSGSVILGFLFQSLPLKRAARFALIWSTLFVVQVLADLIEGTFFTVRISSVSVFVSDALFGLGITFLESLVGLQLFRTAYAPSSVSSMFVLRHLRSWLSRFIVGSVAYFPVYFLFGGLVSPFVLPYYASSSLGLVLPDFPVITAVELLRGLLFSAALLPIILSLQLSRRNTFFLISLLLYVVGAFIPFVAGTTLPWTLKFVHSLEIFADSLVYGGILTILFKGRVMDSAL